MVDITVAEVGKAAEMVTRMDADTTLVKVDVAPDVVVFMFAPQSSLGRELCRHSDHSPTLDLRYSLTAQTFVYNLSSLAYYVVQGFTRIDRASWGARAPTPAKWLDLACTPSPATSSCSQL